MRLWSVCVLMVSLLMLAVWPVQAQGPDDEARAREFLRQTPIDGTLVDPDQLRLVETLQSLAGTHLRFVQYVDAVRVWGTEVRVFLDRAHQPVSAMGHVEPDAATVDRSAQIDQPTAVQAAKDAIGTTVTLRDPERTELVIYPDAGTLTLAWEVILPASEPLGDWRVLVDAKTGAVIASGNLILTGPSPATIVTAPSPAATGPGPPPGK
jgi:Zn-dependent metalloprotease